MNPINGIIFILIKNILQLKYFFAALSDGQVTLFGENSVVGRTMVLHKGVDDLGRGNDLDEFRIGGVQLLFTNSPDTAPPEHCPSQKQEIQSIY